MPTLSYLSKMLTFLRRMRKTLLSEGALPKYLLYAIGEIALVVIGILIALQINNWNQDRKDRIKEVKVLNEVQITLQRNSELLSDYIENLELYNNAADTIIKAIENRLPYKDSYEDYFHLARVDIPINFVSQAGYEELKNAGFDILQDDSLKTEIVTIFETTYPRMREILDGFKTTNQPFIEHLRHHFYDRAFEDKLVPVDYDEILDDHYYYSALMNTKGLRAWYIRLQETCLIESKRVLQLINEKLNESE